MKSGFKKIIICLLVFSMLFGLTACGAEANEKKRFGVVEDTVFDVLLDDYYPDSERIQIDSIANMPEALLAGKIDAYLADEPVARLVCKRYPELTITHSLLDTEFGFAFPFDRTELQAQMNEYLQNLKDTGILESKEGVWFGDIEDLQKIDMPGLSGENGEIKVAISTDGSEKFAFLEDGTYLGYEVDIIVSFCKEYGYSVSFTECQVAQVLDEVAAGNYDIGAGCLTISEERKERMLFSDWYYQGSLVVVEKKTDNRSSILSINDLVGRNIGLQAGTSSEVAFEKYLSEGKPVYYASSFELAQALEDGEIEAYICDEPIVRVQNHLYPNQRQLTGLTSDSYAYIFPKEDNVSMPLRALFNEFLKDAQIDGTMDELEATWFNNTVTKHLVDYSDLSGENGIVNFAVSTEVCAPFVYKDNGSYYGFDIDLATRFCRKYGFALNIADYKFTDMIENVRNGNCDMGGGCITITGERSELISFSDPVYKGGLVLVAKVPELKRNDGQIHTINDLDGQKVAIQSGSMFDKIVDQFLPTCPKEYYNSAADMAVALDTGKITSYIADEPIARLLLREYDTQRILSMLTTESYAFAFPKKNDNSAELQDKMNKFITKIKEDGTLAEIDSVWFGTEEEKKVIDFSDLTGENGELTMAVCTAVGPPFIYVKDNKYVGYDIDVAHGFCKEYGYGLNIVDYNLDGLFSGIGSGKCDMAASCMIVTEERKETMRFSIPDYEGGVVVVIKDIHANKEDLSFFESVSQSFNKTFIRESRWKLFVSGLGVSALIVILSAVFGTLIGFILYFIYWRGNNIYCKTLDVFIGVLKKLPVVVVLMITYYLIFGKVNISGAAVSVIGFTVLFAGNIVGLLKVGVGAVSSSQREAAIALGYTENQTLFKFIMPQAAVHFLPGVKDALESLIKETAVVGYIAVQDLTKVSDIVRSRTYEAFFPLIATALIYFAIACIITGFIRRIEFGVSLDRRKVTLLKGVKTR